MIVKKSSWHYRAYKRWEDRKARLKDDHYQGLGYSTERGRFLDAQAKRRLDLCHYMRVVFILGPVRWFIQGYRHNEWNVLYKKPWLVTLQVAAVLGLIAWTINDPVSLGLTVAAIVGALLAIVAVGYGIVIGVEEKKIPQRAATKISHSLVVEYAKARKSKVCPFIEVKE